MGLWHGVQYFEQKKLNEAPYYRSWPPVWNADTPAIPHPPLTERGALPPQLAAGMER